MVNVGNYPEPKHRANQDLQYTFQQMLIVVTTSVLLPILQPGLGQVQPPTVFAADVVGMNKSSGATEPQTTCLLYCCR